MEETFRTNARIVFEIGKESIENKTIALSEIIKNAYDAIATKCTIIIREEGEEISLFDREISSFEIVDNGIGMSKDDLINNWLVIGTNSKKKYKENIIKNQYNYRIPVGEKGIGRFAINKLGDDITIITKQKGDKTYYLHIDFSEFSDDKMLEDVSVELGEYSGKNTILTDSGTKIIINKLVEKWDYEDIKSVYDEVLKIQSPFKEETDKFEIEFVTKDNSIFDDKLKTEDILKYSLWNASIEIKPFQNYGTMEFNFTPYKEMKNLRESSWLVDIKYQDASKKLCNIDISKYKIGPIKIRLHAFHRTPNVLNMLGQKKKQLKDYLDENGGVRVYRSGQRIFNYGSKDEDWLGLNLKRLNSPGTKLSKNILIGIVELDGDKSQDLVEKTNREGFIENQAFIEFKKIISLVVDEFSLNMIHTKDEIKKLYDKNMKVEKLDESMEELIEELEEAKFENKENKDKILAMANKISKEYQESRKIYLSIASNSVDFNMVFHDVDKQIKNISTLLNFNSVNIDEIRKSIKNISDILNLQKDLITNRDFKEIYSIKLLSKFKEYAYYRIKDHEIRIEYEFQDIKFRAIESQLLRVLINLFDNSIYWIENQKEKKVIIKMIKENNKVVVYYADNGPGFGINDPNILFKPFVTKKINGLGLGLYIVNEIISLHNGKIELINSSNLIPDDYIGVKYRIEVGDFDGDN